MSVLEKAALAAEMAATPPHRMNTDWVAVVRAVLASIEPDDAMVEAFANEFWAVNSVTKYTVHKEHIAAALQAALRSITGGER